jgi:hypothetical protein
VISQRVEDNAFHLRTKAEVICETSSTNFEGRRRNGRNLLQQRSDESAFFG